VCFFRDLLSFESVPLLVRRDISPGLSLAREGGQPSRRRFSHLSRLLLDSIVIAPLSFSSRFPLGFYTIVVRFIWLHILITSASTTATSLLTFGLCLQIQVYPQEASCIVAPSYSGRLKCKELSDIAGDPGLRIKVKCRVI